MTSQPTPEDFPEPDENPCSIHYFLTLCDCPAGS
jgi:hypothetical protein